MLTFENKAFRDIAANAPYEVVEILTNSATYGGGGIFGLYSTVAADSVWAPYIFVHEFGHHIAGLADEYYTSDVAYLPAADRVEPWEPNATALLDPAALKWKDLVTPGTPLPTPWPKEEFEQYTKEIQQKRRAIRAANRPEAEMDALFRDEEKRDTALLNDGPHAGKVGAFEGANYEARGFYRPQADCIMFTRDNVPFCAVCRRAIDAILDLYTAPGRLRRAVRQLLPAAVRRGLLPCRRPAEDVAAIVRRRCIACDLFTSMLYQSARSCTRLRARQARTSSTASSAIRPAAPSAAPRSRFWRRGSGSPARRSPTSQGRFSITIGRSRRLRARDARRRLRRHSHQRVRSRR